MALIVLDQSFEPAARSNRCSDGDAGVGAERRLVPSGRCEAALATSHDSRGVVGPPHGLPLHPGLQPDKLGAGGGMSRERGLWGLHEHARPPAHPPPVLHTVLHNSRYLHPPPFGRRFAAPHLRATPGWVDKRRSPALEPVHKGG